MQIITVLLLGIAFSMDAFAVAICKGLAMEKAKPSACLTVGAWFGGFQALMPLLGFYLGSLFAGYIEAFDHWIACALLVLIGGNMIKESLSKEQEQADASLGFATMLLMALATSIDALAGGVALAMDPATNIWMSIAVIGITTFTFSAVGVKLGNVFGAKYKSRAELVGGIILVLLGIKTVLEHTGVLPF